MRRKNNGKEKKKEEWHPLTKIFILILSMTLIVVIFQFSLNMMLPDSGNLTVKHKTDRNQNFFLDDDTFIGKENAPVLIVEFGEFMCPFCGQVHHDIEPLWKKEYIDTGKARFVFRDFINSDHPQAYPAAVASECADAQNRQWQMYDLLFDNAYSKDTWTKYKDEKSLLDTFEKYAKQIELNMEEFSNCMRNGTYVDEIKQDIFAGISVGVSGTPTIYIGNDETGFTKIRGAQPYSVYKQIIDEKLSSSEFEDGN